MTVSVIVVNHRARELLFTCLEHIEAASAGLDAELIVVENASDGETAALVRRRHPGATVIEESENTGFSPAVARAIAASRGEWVALVNNDANLDAGALRALLAAGESDPRIGSVAAQVRFSQQPGTLNSAGIVVDRLGVAFERLAGAPAAEGEHASRDVFGATACVALYRREMLDAIGGFDASFFAYLEDVDVAWRARAAGWRAVYEPAALAHHRGSASSKEGSAFKYRLVGRNRMRLLAKNATSAQLLRYGLLMVLFDLSYVAFAGLSDRTLAPLSGRLEGLREWRAYRAAGAATRGPAPLAPASAGWRGALGQWRGYRKGGAATHRLESERVALRTSIRDRVAALPPGPRRAIDSVYRRLPIPPDWTYNADGMATIHYSPFTEDATFTRLYDEMAAGWFADEVVDVRWRMWLLTRFALQARDLDGDYAEFGVYRGGCSWMLLSTLDLEPTRRLHLFDTFDGIPGSNLAVAERDANFAGRLSDTSAEYVAGLLAPWDPIPRFWPGDVFKTMPAADTGPLAFAHVDLNAAAPTVHVVEHVYERLVPGGIVVFDDYAFRGYEEQRRAIDALLRDRSEAVIALPTGQGLLIAGRR